MKPGQRHELEAVAHAGEVALKARQLIRRQLLAPVEARRAIVRQHLAGKVTMNGVRKALGVAQVGITRFPPQQVGVGRIGEAADDRILDPAPRKEAEEPLGRAFAADERPIALVDVAG